MNHEDMSEIDIYANIYYVYGRLNTWDAQGVKLHNLLFCRDVDILTKVCQNTLQHFIGIRRHGKKRPIFRRTSSIYSFWRFPSKKLLQKTKVKYFMMNKAFCQSSQKKAFFEASKNVHHVPFTYVCTWIQLHLHCGSLFFDSEIHFLKLPCTYFHHHIWNCNR